MEGRNYKNKSKAQESRALRTHRRSLDQKASRMDQLNKRRNLNLLEPLDEHVRQPRSTAQNTGAVKQGKDPMERLEQLKKWKEQKMLKRKIEARNKKPVFKVSLAKNEDVPKLKGHNQTATKPSSQVPKTSAPKPTTKKQVKAPVPAPVPAPSRRVTRSSVASEPPKNARTTAATRHSTGNQRTARNSTMAATKTATKTTTKAPTTSTRTSRVSNTSTKSVVKPAEKVRSPPKKIVRRSTRTSTRTASTSENDIEVNAKHITKRVQEQNEDDLVFQYASSNFVFDFQPMASASLLFPESGESDSSPKLKRSARLSSRHQTIKDSSTVQENHEEKKGSASSQNKVLAHEEKAETKEDIGDGEESSDDVFREETTEQEKSDDQTKVKVAHEQDNEVNEQQSNEKDDEPMHMDTEEQELAKEPATEAVNCTDKTPKSERKMTRKSCIEALRTPNINAPMSALKQRRSMSVPAKSTPNDRRVGFKMPATTPSELVLSSKRLRKKDLRRSTALRGLSPEECVIVLSHSPMIEMERRPYKAAKSPVAQLDFQEDEIEAMIKEQDKAEKEKQSKIIAETTPVENASAEQKTEKASENVAITAVPSETSQEQPEKTETVQKPTVSESTETVPKPTDVEQTSSENTQIQDVPYFRNLVISETSRLTDLCDKWNEINNTTADISDEVRGQIRTTVGQAHLLMGQRFKQFSGLVDNCEFNLGDLPTTCTDLVGFWEMVYIQVEDVDMKFSKLDKLRENNWKEDKPVVKKKLVKKNPIATGTKGPSKPSGPSKFAAFRAKMLQQKKEEEEKKLEEEKREKEKQAEEDAEEKMVTESPQNTKEDTKTFDAGFFQVCSPVQSPKFHCEGGSPNNLSGRQSSRNSLVQPCASPMLKSVLDKSARRMSRSNPNSPLSGANVAMRLSRSNPGSPMNLLKNTVDLSSAVTSLRQEVLTKQLASSYAPSIFSPDTENTPQSASSLRRSGRRRTLNQSVEATSSPANRRSLARLQKNTPTTTENTNTGVDFMAYLLPSSTTEASPAARDHPSDSLSSMEAEDGPQASPQVKDTDIPQGSPQVHDVDMAPPSKVSLTQEFLNMPSTGKERTRLTRLSSGRSLSHSERRKSRQSAVAKRHSVRFTSSTASEDSSPLARMPLTPFNRDYPGPKVVSPPQEEVFLFTPPTRENAKPQRGSSTTPATRLSKLSFKSPSVQESSGQSTFTPRRSTRQSVANDLMTFS